MDKRSEFEMTKDQRSLLNAGHGPPVPQGPPGQQGFPIRQGPPLAYRFDSGTANRPTTSVFHRTATWSDLGLDVLTSPGFYRDGRYIQTFTNGSEIDDEHVLVQKIKEKDQELQKISSELRLMRATSGKNIVDDLVRQNYGLEQQLTAKMTEFESLKTKHQHLIKQLTSLPDPPIRLPSSSASDDFIDLIPSGDAASGNDLITREQDLDAHDAMMKSVQCSEPSMEQVTDGKDETKETKIASPIVQKKGEGISSSSSSSSFEVVGQGSCLGSPVGRDDYQIPSTSMKAEVEALRSEVTELSRKLEAEKEERKREAVKLKERLDEINLREEKDNDRTSEVTPTDRQPDDQRQNVSELVSAKWKLTEQNRELTREVEDLKKKEQEWRSAVSHVDKLQEELLRKQRQMMDAEEQLETQHQRIQELEARIREMEDMRVAESFKQKGMVFSGSAGDLATENALLKHQVEAYKEDFEVERKDRQNQVAQTDTLQRCYDTLRSDLDVARQQLKKYENDITMLRIDNNTLKTRLRSVTEEVDALKEGRQFTPATLKAGALVPKPVPQNSFAQQKPSAPPSGQAGDWECQACTYKNPAPRTFCEMCGTHGPISMPMASQVPNCTYVPNIPVRELAPVQWDVAQSATPLLSNLRNYGDIETD